ncbi:MAG: 16S rRNA (cytosine(1402)-N(4))-methyltransferase RsmH [Phycisphaeraceae bacterium]|nr:16S rRNA (cytosine(1402)-N(4))-methyltransferase RsmH [Phycisphaeraceae bacterium]
MTKGHIPVLLNEVLATLDPGAGETYVDCTAGLGGHAAAIAPRLGSAGTVVLCDVDPANLSAAARRIQEMCQSPNLVTIRANFADLPRQLTERGLRANLLLADLGFASVQVDQADRGFSFSREGPLDMRLDPDSPVTAAQLVNSLPQYELARLIHEFGEEKQAGRIAQKIAESRADAPITTTTRLAAIIREALGSRARRPGASIDPATRTFQALRIAVNDEMGNLAALLDAIERQARAIGRHSSPAGWAGSGARLAVISFHSLEDRLVKRSFAAVVKRGHARDLVRKPIVASPAETAANPRSRSAKMRAIQLAAATPE